MLRISFARYYHFYRQSKQTLWKLPVGLLMYCSCYTDSPRVIRTCRFTNWSRHTHTHNQHLLQERHVWNETKRWRREGGVGCREAYVCVIMRILTATSYRYKCMYTLYSVHTAMYTVQSVCVRMCVCVSACECVCVRLCVDFSDACCWFWSIFVVFFNRMVKFNIVKLIMNLYIFYYIWM